MTSAGVRCLPARGGLCHRGMIVRGLRAPASAFGRRSGCWAMRAVTSVTSVAVLAALCAACTSSQSSSPSRQTAASSSSVGTAQSSISATAPSTATNGPSSSASAGKAPGGSITQTVASVVAPTRAAVGLSATAAVDSQVRVSLVQIRSQYVAAHAPGEISGSAIVIKIRVTNRSGRAVDVSSASVTVLDSAGQVGTASPEAPAAPFHGRLGARSSATAVYVFEVPQARRNRVDVFVSYSAGAPVAHFRGDAA